IWGVTPGKWVLGVRVCLADDVIPPGLWRGLGRAVLVQGLAVLPEAVVPALLSNPSSDVPLVELVQIAFSLPAAAVILRTARRRNGFGCLQQLLSGPRVGRGPPSPRFRVAPAPPSHGSRPADLPQRVGPFPVRDERWRTGDDRVLGSVDPNLDRPVWLWLRPA